MVLNAHLLPSLHEPCLWFNLNKRCYIPCMGLLSGIAGPCAGKDGTGFIGGGAEVGGRGGMVVGTFEMPCWKGAMSS